MSENLIALDNVSLAYGLDVLLDKIKLQIYSKERVCLIGRNGAGKSSLLKIIEGFQLSDSGTVWRKPHLRLSRLKQELPQNLNMSVYEFVSLGISEIGSLLTSYQTLINKLNYSNDNSDLVELERLQHLIDVKNGWQFDQMITKVLDRLKLNPNNLLSELSGGWQRRAALAQALVSSPELLLLDEPTNHLDIEAIQWLEDQLINLDIGLIFVTHDRSLLQRLATRIIEIDRGKLTSWPGDYSNFLRRKEEILSAEENQNKEFDKKLALEEKWIRQGIKARRTRNEGRVRELEALRIERSKRREVIGKASINVNEAQRSGRLVIEANSICHTFGSETIIDNFSMRIMRGDRIGLIGPNGAGKTTFINILLEKIKPGSGEILVGTKLEVSYFDQLRETLDLEKTVIENVSDGGDTIQINGKSKHIIGYLGDFLFTPKRAMTPVKALSGGECNRLLLAKLFSRPANLLVLDEPTNDLDIETLELLEELLCGYNGTIILVSHDRSFLDNVVTSSVIFKNNGKLIECVGGYQNFINEYEQKQATAKIKKSDNKKKSSTKLSFNEVRELSQLPNLIENLELEQSILQETISHPDFYKNSQDEISLTFDKIKDLEQKLTNIYNKWEYLENKKNSN
ncbi:ATP-binding cassette domain-containing protein [Gammaproteobacteria bacterium]|nr:ATP-binding cassette domain-containing protein [Gammaproteobacteria bacterium]